MRTRGFIPVLCVLMLGFLTRSAFAVKIADITRMYGARTNTLTGMGLVTGLKGTGDGGSFLPAMRPLSGMLGKFHNATAVADLTNASNVAIVAVWATLPAGGVVNGDHLDVHVTAIGAAVSLKYGTLYNVSMMGPDGKPFVPVDAAGHPMKPIPFATGTGSIDFEDPSNLTNGVVKGGAVMEVDLPDRYIDRSGRFKLIIDDPAASWVMASSIAKLINESNESGDTIAVALDTKQVLVTIPAAERAAPDSFIANVLQLPVRLQPAEARVRLNTKTGTIIATGDVEISPTVISHKGLTITTVSPSPVPTLRNPQVISKSTIPLDTTNSGGAKLSDLATAFDQLKVPVEDRIDIIKELYKTGYLHAKLNIDGVDQ